LAVARRPESKCGLEGMLEIGYRNPHLDIKSVRVPVMKKTGDLVLVGAGPEFDS
jgi:hypothetical protein